MFAVVLGTSTLRVDYTYTMHLEKNLYFNQIGFVGVGNHHHHHDVRVWRDAHTDNMASTSVRILRVRGGGGVRLMVVKCVVRAAA